MGLFRTGFYGSLFLGTFVTLHFAEVEPYAPVKQHPLYQDFITPVMSDLQAFSEPYIEKIMTNPEILALMGIEGVAQDDLPAGRAAHKPLKVAGDRESADDEDAREGGSRYRDNFAMPSQMGFSLVQLGEKLKKRSVLSTEGNDSTYFEMPDTSRLWLQRDSVVEVGWTDKPGGESELLLRVERGMMHIERPGAATGRVYLVTNSGVRYALSPSDGWMATAQMGVADKDSFPDAEMKMSERYLDYVRRATLGEARELSKLLRSDGRREAMLYQDQLRLAAEDEDRQRSVMARQDIMPVDIVSIPLEIPSRRGGRDMAQAQGRMPASVASANYSSFPSRRPASISSLDEGTRIASESKIMKWTDGGKCRQAKQFFEKLREEHGLAASDTWSIRMKQNFAQRCP